MGAFIFYEVYALRYVDRIPNVCIVLLAAPLSLYLSRLAGIVDGTEPGFNYGIIVCAMRSFTREMSGFYSKFIDLHKYESPRRLQGT